MRSPLPFPCVPDRPYKILLVQVGTLSFSHPSFGVPVLFIYLWARELRRKAKEAARTRDRQAAASSQNEAEESDATTRQRMKRQEGERREWDDREVA